SVFLSIAICIRFAMLPGIPVLAAVAFSVSKRTASHGETVLLVLLSPVVTLISFYLLRSTNLDSLSVLGVTSMDLSSFRVQGHWPAFVQMADQILPVGVLGTWLSLSIIIVGLILVPAATAFVTCMPHKRGVLLICIAYVF